MPSDLLYSVYGARPMRQSDSDARVDLTLHPIHPGLLRGRRKVNYLTSELEPKIIYLSLINVFENVR